MLSLALDFRTVFASEDTWEEGAAGAQASPLPVLRKLNDAPLCVAAGEPVSFPLWASGIDVGAGSFRLRPAAGGPVVGSLAGCIYTFVPTANTPSPFALSVEYQEGEEAPVATEYSIRWTTVE